MCEVVIANTKLGRAKRCPHRISNQARLIDWQCTSCGCTDANQFIRDGHYRRSLEIGWRHLDALQVPMLECQRYWLDAPQRAIFGSGLARSLRQRVHGMG